MGSEIVLTNIGQVAMLEGNSEKPKVGKSMMDLSIVENGAIAISGGKIIAVGPSDEVLSQINIESGFLEIELPNMLALPGFIDSHTHLAFGGSRENDFAMKLAGKTYMEILEAGGGILNTLRETRSASQNTLQKNAFSVVERMLAEGTTTIEAKSGYGLDTETELKQLRAIGKLKDIVSMNLHSTFLGAHAVPPEYEGRTDDYVDLVVNEMIPAVAESHLAEFCDVFCEKGVFDIEQSRKILLAAKEAGLKLKIHADEIVQLGGAELAAEVGAVSADHLLMSSDDGLEAMRRKGTIATLLPATAFSLNTEYARARDMIEMELPVVLATDFNPNCANESLFFTIALSCYKMKMQPREVISALTINAAHAVGQADVVGSIEVGKRADIVILECPNPEFLAYRFGINLVHTVIVGGEVVHTKLGP